MNKCNICGSINFTLGPAQRTSNTGFPPKCTQCLSLERHRALRRVMDSIPDDQLSWRRALQFSPDNSIDPNRFKLFDGSFYGRTNSIDMQSIEREDGSYDWISANHVIEFIKDDRKAFLELMRVTSDRGIVQIGFASSFTFDTISHWNEPQGINGNYHRYGNMVVQYFTSLYKNLLTIIIRSRDPVTDQLETFHFFCKDKTDAQVLINRLEGHFDLSVVE